MPSQLLKLYGGGFSPMQYAPAIWLDAADQSTMYLERTGASATTLVTSDADPVGSWLDKSGNGRHVTAPSDAARPTFKTAIQNGRSVTRFDGSDDTFSITGASGFTGSNVTTFIVFKFSTTTLQTVFGCTSERLNFNQTNTAHFHFHGGSTTYGRYDTAIGSFFIMSSVYDGSEVAANRLYVFRNGTQKTLTIPNTIPTATGSITAGNVGSFAGGGSQFLNGDICELILYTKTLSTSQRQQVERYLGSKWGISVA